MVVMPAPSPDAEPDAEPPGEEIYSCGADGKVLRWALDVEQNCDIYQCLEEYQVCDTWTNLAPRVRLQLLLLQLQFVIVQFPIEMACLCRIGSGCHCLGHQVVPHRKPDQHLTASHFCMCRQLARQGATAVMLLVLASDDRAGLACCTAVLACFLQVHNKNIYCILYSSTLDCLITGGEDATIQLHYLSGGAQALRL